MTRILVADDEGIIRRGIQVILEDGFGEDVQVKLARNGEEALEMADAGGMEKLAEAMEKAGISYRLTEKIFWKNADRFLWENLG